MPTSLRSLSLKFLGDMTWLVFPALLLGCSPCDNEIVREVPSPDNSRVAVVSYAECGAIARDASHVSVHPGPKGPHEVEHVIFSARDQQAIDLSWKSASELVVRCDGCRDNEILLKVAKVGTLKVTYELPDN